MTWSSFLSSPDSGYPQCGNIWRCLCGNIWRCINLITFLSPSHVFSVAVWCLNPTILNQLILTEVTPTICGLFQRKHALWSSFAGSFKMVLVDSKNVSSETTFTTKILLKPSEAPLSCTEEHDVRRLRLFVFYKIGSSSSARAAVSGLQKPAIWGILRTEMCVQKEYLCPKLPLSPL